MGAKWLKPRVIGKAVIHELQCVEQVKETDDRVALTLSNNKLLRADHIILGTGYRVNVKRLPMLHLSVVTGIEAYHNAPILNSHFESTLLGLYFVGFSSVSSCGPLYRFVMGTDAEERRVASSVARQMIQIRKN